MTTEQLNHIVHTAGLTVEEIAQESRLSVGTVYIVLRGEPTKPRTRIRVQLAVKRLSARIIRLLAS